MTALLDHTPVLDLEADLLARIAERERTNGWRRVKVNTVAEWERLLARSVVNKAVFCQSELTTLTVADTKTRYVFWRTWPCAPGELAREYLRLCYEASPYGRPWADVRGRRVAGHPYWRKKMPLLCRPVRDVELAYVDIRHAFWQILTPFALDTILTRHGRLIEGVVPFLRVGELIPTEDDAPDTVAAKRSLRLAIPGTLFARGLNVRQEGEDVVRPVASRWANPSLFRIVADTLTAVCRDLAERFSVFAWLTDACIVEGSQRQAVQGFLAEEWGLASSVKAAGRGSVWSVTSYQVGDKQSEDWTNGNALGRPMPLSKVGKVERAMVRGLR